MNQSLPAEVVETLDAVLSATDPAHRALRDQIPLLAVQGRCECGCGTTYFDIDVATATPATTGPGIVGAASALLVTEAGAYPGEVVVFAQNGYLSWLEVCSWTDDFKLTLTDAVRWLVRAQ